MGIGDRKERKGKDFGEWKSSPLCVCLEVRGGTELNIFFAWYLILQKSSTV